MKPIWAVVGLLVALGGAWAYARYDLAARVHAFRGEVDEMGFVARGGGLQDVDAVADEIEADGRAAGLTVTQVDVQMVPLSEAGDRAGAATRVLAGELADDERAGAPAGHHADDEVVDMGSGALHVQGTLVEVQVEVRAKKWLWSTTERFTVRREVGRQLVQDR